MDRSEAISANNGQKNSKGEDGALTLSASTMAALQDFYKEQELLQQPQPEQEQRSTVSENWQLSQFWYDDETAEAFAQLCLKVLNENGEDAKVACISTPTIYTYMKKNYGDHVGQLMLFEYDRRFEPLAKSDFVYYDYNSPLDIPRELRSSFDLVIADPPFLSEECLIKTAVTIKYLVKDKIVLCTGAIMREMAKKHLGLIEQKFLPRHANNLANEFRCFSNFEFEQNS